MAEQHAAYTHRGWKADMAAMRAVYAEQVVPAMQQVHAGLVQADAGRTQMAQWATAVAMVTELGTVAERILATSGADGDTVAEAQQAAGGVTEVYGDKRSHTVS